MNKTYYKDLMMIPGISSHESRVRAYMKKVMEKHPHLEIIQDKLGSIFAYKKSKNPNAKTVLIAGHMDEVGLMVKSILPNGGIKVLPIGGLSGDVFISQLMYVYTKDGKKIPGVFGSIPPHLKQSNQTDIDDLVFDTGARSKEEVLKMGINLGDMIIFDTPFEESADGTRFMAKSIDNRYGCALSLELIDEVANIDLPYNLVIGATVQEEVGLRGAETATNLFKPDMFIALDASPVNDLFDKTSMAKLGNGFLLRIIDPRNIMLTGLRSYFENLANRYKIKYQAYVSMGGTDAAKAIDMHEGILATTIGLPARYIHSSVAMAEWSDVEAARNMVLALIHDLTPEIIDSLKESNR
jgi:glutamyl aminopeptidase